MSWIVSTCRARRPASGAMNDGECRTSSREQARKLGSAACCQASRTSRLRVEARITSKLPGRPRRRSRSSRPDEDRMRVPAVDGRQPLHQLQEVGIHSRRLREQSRDVDPDLHVRAGVGRLRASASDVPWPSPSRAPPADGGLAEPTSGRGSARRIRSLRACLPSGQRRRRDVRSRSDASSPHGAHGRGWPGDLRRSAASSAAPSRQKARRRRGWCESNRTSGRTRSSRASMWSSSRTLSSQSSGAAVAWPGCRRYSTWSPSRYPTRELAASRIHITRS